MIALWVIAWLLSLVMIGVAAFHYRRVYDAVQAARKAHGLRERITKSVFLDPDDIATQAKLEEIRKREELNQTMGRQ